MKFEEDECTNMFPSYPLHEAVMLGDVDAVRTLLLQGADVNERTNLGETTLHCAVSLSGKEQVEMQNRLKDLEEALQEKLKAPPDPAAFSMKDVTNMFAQFNPIAMMGKRYEIPIHTTLSEDDTTLIQLLLEHGAEVNNTDTLEGTALMKAAENGRLQSMNLLLEHGAEIDATDKNGLTALMKAAERGRLEVVQRLLERGADWDRRTKRGATALFMAAQGGRVEIAQMLLQHGVDVNTVSVTGMTALSTAAVFQRTEMVAYLRAQGARIGFLEAIALDDLEQARLLPALSPADRSILWGINIVRWIVQTGRPALLHLLVERGLQIDTTHEEWERTLKGATMRGEATLLDLMLQASGRTQNREELASALHMAIVRGDQENVRLLIERGAPVQEADQHGITPLVTAIMFGHRAIAKLLIDAGADANGIAGEPMPPLVYAANREDTEMVRLLIEHGATPNDQNSLALAVAHNMPEIKKLLIDAVETTLHGLATSGNTQAVLAKLDAGESVEARDNMKYTPLIWAAAKGHTETVRALLNRGADIHAVNSSGQTPLRSACQGGHVETVRLLIERGADIHATNNFGHTALWNAVCKQSTELISLLTEAGAEIGAKEAAFMGDEAKLRRLLEDMPDEERTNRNMTPLMAAAYGGQNACILLLLGCGTNIEEVDGIGQTALTWAVNGQHIETVRLLLDRGADPNHAGINRNLEEHFNASKRLEFAEISVELSEQWANPKGQTPLNAAVCYSDLDIIRLLVKRGADVNSSDDILSGTPLMRAAMVGRVEVVRLLLELGADVHQKDKQGNTALSYAKMSKKSEDVVAILLAAGVQTA